MLLSGDVKSLEVVTCAYLSRDEVLCEEVRQKTDFHALNQKRFGLPSRVVAKRFKFKLIYGASAYGYTTDADFLEVGYSQKRWQEVIDEYYNKYKGIGEWHKRLVQNVIRDGFYLTPSGRRYDYPKSEVVEKLYYWRPKILNYPVQGLGADLVMLARISLWRRLNKNPEFKQVLPVATVHDSIVLDIPDQICYNVNVLLKSCVNDVPKNFERCFGKPFDLPLDVEIKVGKNLGQMEIMK